MKGEEKGWRKLNKRVRKAKRTIEPFKKKRGGKKKKGSVGAAVWAIPHENRKIRVGK